uniref:Pleckstrin homology domain-containing family F member 2 n=1 Tax=Romanomermis culicivorax TaxID=13658 RepID=A0A915L3A2_ROMCU
MVDRLINSEANARRIAAVEHCFSASGVVLAIPGRVLVGEGVLIKMCRKKPKPRQFFLFNDILVYATIILSKRKYHRQHVIQLDSLELEDLQDDGNLTNGWQIKTPTKSFNVYAATSTEKREWISHIKRCIEDLMNKTGSHKPICREKAAVWVPDPEAQVCMKCKKTKFTVVQRRHHCRKCGSVVCNSCSTKRFLLPHISKKPVRVCDSCYDLLTKICFASSPSPLDVQILKNNNVGNSSGEEDSDDEDDGLNQEQADITSGENEE